MGSFVTAKLQTARRLARRTARNTARGLRRSGLARLYADAVKALRVPQVRREVRHLWGDGPTPCGPGEVVVVSLVRNGEAYVRSFVDHYSALGVRQIVLLDNGSDDSTLDLARRYENVTLLRSRLPYRDYQQPFKQYLISTYGVGGWRLHVDIDELFDYPRSADLSLADLLAYLNAGGYTAMVAQILDMFAPATLQSWPSSPDDHIRTIYTYYDISNVRSRGYAEQYGTANLISNEAIRLYWGGIRNTLFGTQDWLSKHPLVRLEGGLRLRGHVSHDVYRARVADISGVLYHYKFIDRFVDQAEQAVREGNYWRGSRQYRSYMAVLAQDPDLQIRRETAQRLESVDDLVRQGFLAVTPAYEAWAGRS